MQASQRARRGGRQRGTAGVERALQAGGFGLSQVLGGMYAREFETGN